MINSKIRIIPESIQLLKISDEEYFGEKYKNFISNSRLALINPDQDGSPELYKRGLVDENLTDSFYFGSAVHNIILQNESYKIVTNVAKPSGKMYFAIEDIIDLRKKGKSIYESIKIATEKVGYFKNKLSDENLRKIISASLEYYKHKYVNPQTHEDEKELIYLDSYNRYRAFECIKSVKKSKDVMELLHPSGLLEKPKSSNEDTLICEIVVNLDGKDIILPLKCKIDNWTLDLENKILTLNDLKTTSKEIGTFKSSFEKYHYPRQIGMYFWILHEYIKYNYNDDFKKYANIVVIEKSKPFAANIFKVTPKYVKEGFIEFKRLITEVARLYESDI